MHFDPNVTTFARIDSVFMEEQVSVASFGAILTIVKLRRFRLQFGVYRTQGF